MCEKAVLNRLYCNLEVNVFTGASKSAERLMLQFSRNPGWYNKEDLLLRDNSGDKSPEYKRLTGEFYL